MSLFFFFHDLISSKVLANLHQYSLETAKDRFDLNVAQM